MLGGGRRYSGSVADRVIRMSLEEFEARMGAGGPSTPDDVGVKTIDGRHLKTKDEILEWLAEIEADRVAGRFVDLSAEPT